MDDGMDEGILQAARVIRSYLPMLVGPAAAAGLDQQVAELLAASGQDENSTAKLRVLLGRDEATSAFLAEVLADAPHFRPPDMQPQYQIPKTRGLKWEALPGDQGPILHAGVYVCPHGDFTWYRPAVGVPVPVCLTHGVALVKV